MQFARYSTALASPIVPFLNLATKANVNIPLQCNSGTLGLYPIHVDLFRLSMSLSFSGSGSSSTNFLIETKKVSGSTLWSVAPARKSAQVISMQSLRDF
jgi:hypothetical protein